MVTLMFVLYSLPGLMDSVTSIGETSSEISAVENSILQTSISIDTITTSSGSNTVNFNLNNDGSQKLWNYDDFELFITYDADISGVRTKVTEKSNYGTPTDFKIQRGALIMAVDELTTPISDGTDFSECTGDCFIKFVSTRRSSNGQTTSGWDGSEGHNDFSAYIENDGGLRGTNGGDIDFTRYGTRSDDYDNRIQWEIWEYVGKQGGPNEMKVMDTGTCDFAGVDLTCTGAQTPTSAADDNDVVVFITGIASEDTSSNEMTAMLVTSEWVGGGTDNPVFTRDANNGNPPIHVSYAVVEFTGSNWSVQRQEHTGTGASPSTEIITDVGDITRAFFHQQQRNVDGATEGLCEAGEEVRLTAPNTLTYTHPWGGNWGGGDMTEVTWVISNSNSKSGQTMIVENVDPPFRGTGGGGGEVVEDNWQVAITPLVYNTFETAITGLTTQSNGCGTAFPRGFIVTTLSDSSTVDLYQTSDGQNQEYAFQVTQFPRPTPSQWKIVSIQNDSLDPNIINQDETAEITASLTYPIFSGGNLAIVISTDKGVTSSNSVIVT